MRPHRITAAVVTVLALLLAGCGAASRTPAATATLVPCEFPPPAQRVPLMGPGILTAGISMFLFAFQEYLTAAVLTDVVARTVPVFVATQLGRNLPLLQQAGAAAVLLTLPVIGFAFVAQRHLVAGLGVGSVKG
ncbi:hypothetical protein WHI96_11015 [Pseudonocardia tropica]|uniref:ABC transmembrane type-1 domain-containing protein n=1 Tax=Pseudonocardia tropica TaxID=681289 RepID=A0ABV1JTS8_9PSEU